jgi:nucleotide-binding universal stress UspA family protein
MSWFPKKTVVVPVDFAESSADAISTALELVSNPAGVHVMHVLLPLDYMSPGMVFDTGSEKSRMEATTKYCAEFLKKHGFTGVQSTICLGDPGHEVTEYATKVKADLIVIPSHGYHGVKRLVLGSVAEKVIRHADCPVLVLRRRDAQ